MPRSRVSEEMPGVPSRGRVAIPRAALPVLPILGSSTYLSLLTVDRASKEVYGIPGWGVVVTLVLLGLTVVGCGLIAWSRQPAFSSVVLAGVALAALGFLTILSFGVLALLVAGGVLAWAASDRWQGARSGRAAVGALLAGAPLALLAGFAIAGPLVDCETDGVTSGENVFLGMRSTAGTSTASESASGDPDGTFSGRVEGDGYEYSYECRSERLVKFDLRWR
jgi:hypothetical protein